MNEQTTKKLDRNLIKTIESGQVILITGKRGSGKSGLLYSILENSQKENSYIVGIAKEYHHLLPDTIKPLPISIDTLNNLPSHATIGIDEGGNLFPSRESFKPMNKLISKLLMNARKSDQFLVFATHTMRAFDVSVVLNCDALLFKEPSLLHSKLERAEILKIVQEAKRAFDNILPSERVKHAYLVSQDYEGMLEVELPSFWTEELSHAVASVPKVYNDETIYRIGGKEMGRRKVKEKKVEEVEEMVDEVTTTKKLPEVSGTAAERINAMIRDGMRIVPNYYASRGDSIIELVCPKELADDIEAMIYEYKTDPKAPDVMAQEPSFVETRPDFADGMVAFQLCLDDPRNLLSSGYSIKSMIKELKEKPVLITISTTIREKLIT